MKKQWLHTSFSLKQLAHRAGQLPATLLLRYSYVLTFVIFGLGFLVGCLLLARVFWGPSPLPPTAQPHVPELKTGALDELELWLEERQNAVETGLRLPPRQFFDVEPPATP